MCTVLLRFAPGTAQPLILGAVRDEFIDRPWDPPAPHWPSAPGVIGGRDRQAGGTWLAVAPGSRSIAALLNGVPVPPLPPAVRPSRGALPLAALTGTLDESTLDEYERFHLLLARPDAVTLWTWDGTTVERRDLGPGDHIIVNRGVDATDDPLVPHFAPLLAAASAEPEDWLKLLSGDGLDPTDDRALLVRREYQGRVFASGSAALIAVGDAMTFDFTAAPATPSWYRVPL
jgi:uncharacterized protein with NRDE domain